MQFSDQSQTPNDRPYGGVAFQRSPGGFEFVVVSWVIPGVGTPVPIIAILGYGGCSPNELTRNTCLRAATTDPLSAAVALVCLRESNGPRWPAVENGQLVPDRRRDRLFALELHPYQFNSEILGLRPVGDESIYLQRLSDVLGKHSSGLDQAHEVASIAKWNFSKTEYGDPTDASRQSAQRAAQGLVATFCETQRTGTADALGLVAPLQAEIDKCREREDLTQLAAWLELLVAGARRLHDTVRVVQQEGLKEISSWNNLGTAPSRVTRALEDGSGLHRMFYDSHPEFGLDTWIWRGRGPKTVALRSPRLIGIARYQLGRNWWHGLNRAFASHDQEEIERGLGKLRQLNAALATRALVEPEEGSEAAMTLGFGADVDFVTIDLDTLPDNDPSPPPFDIDAQIQAALRPRHWEVYRRVNFEKEKAKDVATSMGLSPGRISQLLSEAKRDLKESPLLNSLWENLSE